MNDNLNEIYTFNINLVKGMYFFSKSVSERFCFCFSCVSFIALLFFFFFF